MKKKFLALICFLLLVSVLLCSCTIVIERPTENTGDDPEAGAQNGTSQTTKQTENTKKPTPNGEQESQKIEKINGMSARDLVKNFYKEYASLTSLDIVIDTFTTVEGERYQIHEELKLNGSDVYMLMDVDGEEIKIWNVGGVLYVDGQGEKVRADIDIEEYTGTSINDMLTSYLPEQLPDIYLGKLNSSQIRSAGDGTYYFSVNFTAEEAVSMQGEYMGFSETYYCNSAGTIIRIVSSYNDGSSLKIVFNSYGKYVTVNPPANANEFVEKELEGGFPDVGDDNTNGGGTVIPGGIDSDDAYIIYWTACDNILNSNKYKVDVYDRNNELYISYAINGYDEWVYMYPAAYYDGFRSEYNFNEQWSIGNKTYGKNNMGIIQEVTDPTDEFFYPFSDAQDMMWEACLVYHRDDLLYLTMDDRDGYLYYIELAVDWGDGMIDCYTYVISKSFAEVYVTVTTYCDGIEISSRYFDFTHVGQGYEIKLPQ